MEVVLFKGIRDDQTRARQVRAGRFYTTDRQDAGDYGDVVECRVVEFKRLYSASNPIALAQEWGERIALSKMQAMRDALPRDPQRKTVSHKKRWAAYHACFYVLDKALAKEARHRGYDGIHYKWWRTYAKL
jgi:hypothetical protein